MLGAFVIDAQTKLVIGLATLVVVLLWLNEGLGSRRRRPPDDDE